MPAIHAGRPATGIGHYVRDIVYGSLDGAVTTLAVVAGSAGARLGVSVALILGLANLVADGISMGASNYLGLKSELQQEGKSVAQEKPWRHGAATFAAFLVAGAVPLAGYVATPPALRLAVAAALSAGVFFAVGAARARFLPGRRPLGLGAEMLVIGGVAASAAYAVGYLVQTW